MFLWQVLSFSMAILNKISKNCEQSCFKYVYSCKYEIETHDMIIALDKSQKSNINLRACKLIIGEMVFETNFMYFDFALA